MARSRLGGPGFAWWVLGVLWCVPAGALAGGGRVAENVALEVVAVASCLPLLYDVVMGRALAFVGGKEKDDAAEGARVVS